MSNAKVLTAGVVALALSGPALHRPHTATPACAADNGGITLPAGIAALGMSSDHFVLDVGDHRTVVGDELRFGLDYSALVRAMTSPFIAKSEQTHPSMDITQDQ